MQQLLSPIYNLIRKAWSPMLRPITGNNRTAVVYRHPYPEEIVSSDTWYWHNRCKLPELAITEDSALHAAVNVTGAGVLHALAFGFDNTIPPYDGPIDPWIVTLTIDGTVVYTASLSGVAVIGGEYTIAVGFDGGANGLILPDAIPFYSQIKVEVQSPLNPSFHVFCDYRTTV